MLLDAGVVEMKIFGRLDYVVRSLISFYSLLSGMHYAEALILQKLKTCLTTHWDWDWLVGWRRFGVY